VKRSAGFTLLEMLVATLIMGIAIVGTLSAISTSMRSASRVVEHDRAELLARSKLNELLADKTIPRDRVFGADFDPAQAGGRPAGWRARVSLFDRPQGMAPGMLVLDRIELEVWWAAGDGRRTLSLDGYRVRMVLPQDMPQGPPAGGAP
jgi:type II secretion system protein I